MQSAGGWRQASQRQVCPGAELPALSKAPKEARQASQVLCTAKLPGRTGGGEGASDAHAGIWHFSPRLSSPLAAQSEAASTGAGASSAH